MEESVGVRSVFLFVVVCSSLAMWLSSGSLHAVVATALWIDIGQGI